MRAILKNRNDHGFWLQRLLTTCGAGLLASRWPLTFWICAAHRVTRNSGIAIRILFESSPESYLIQHHGTRLSIVSRRPDSGGAGRIFRSSGGVSQQVAPRLVTRG